MTTTTMSVPTPSKLPVWRTVGASYAIVWRNLGQLVRISWLWILIMIPVYAALHWLALRNAGETTGLAHLLPAVILPAIIELPFLASIAVAWHRLVLRQERVLAGAYLRLDQTVWTYILWSAALLAAWWVPLFLTREARTQGAALLLANDAAGLFNANILGLVAAVVVCLIAAIALLRLSLVLPAVAVGESLSPAQAWRCTRGNTFRFAMAAGLCLLSTVLLLLLLLLPAPVAVAVMVPGFFLESVERIARSYWYVVPTSLGFAVVITIVEVTFLSLAYRFFTGPGDGRASPSA